MLFMGDEFFPKISIVGKGGKIARLRKIKYASQENPSTCLGLKIVSRIK